MAMIFNWFPVSPVFSFTAGITRSSFFCSLNAFYHDAEYAVNCLRKLWLNRQKLAVRDFDSAEGSKNVGILCVFPIFWTARMGQKIHCPAAGDLFRVSLKKAQKSAPLGRGIKTKWPLSLIPYCSERKSRVTSDLSWYLASLVNLSFYRFSAFLPLTKIELLPATLFFIGKKIRKNHLFGLSGSFLRAAAF